jgi:hypothetical protein
MKFTFLLFASMLVLPRLANGTSVKPLPEDGTLLLRQCQTTIKVMDAGSSASEQDTLSAQFCGNYIKGYADALIAAKDICVSVGVSNGAMVRAYSSFMQQHPEFLKRYQGDGVRASLKLNYSCRKGASGR